MSNSVAVTIVTYNSARFIRRCLESVLSQHTPVSVYVVDNASSDHTLAALNEFRDRVYLQPNATNIGFAAGQNQAIALCRQADWVLVLNPDTLLAPDFLSQLIDAARDYPAAGALCGKLLRMGPDYSLPVPPLLDSTGMFFVPSLRHFDRGSGSVDRGQFDRTELVFGATGAAALFRRAMIDDVSVRGEFFDSAFFAYREDADLAWRARWAGWQTLYVPAALAWHVRAVLPERRRHVSATLNMHSVKNRFLMRINNLSAPLYLRLFWAITGRDLVIVAACLLREWQSLPAFYLLVRLWRRQWRFRREVKRRIDHETLARWFAREPVSLPADLAAVPAPSCHQPV